MYIIGASTSGPLKLGISAHPDRRVRQLQTGHADRLHLFHSELVESDLVPPGKARLFEKLLHRDLRHKRKRGEWFNLNVDDARLHIQFTLIHYDIDNLAEKMRLRRV